MTTPTTATGVHAGHDGWYKNCHHPDCHAHRERYRKRWTYERSQGKKRLTDATPARRHIETLLGAGWSLRSIAGAAGIAPTTVHHLKAGQATAKHAIIAAVLAVDPTTVPGRPSRQTAEPFVPRVGTTRRIQALLFMGWPHAEISKRANIKSATLLNQQGRWVTRTSHDKIVAVYDQLAMTPGPSPRTRGWARTLGYVGPLAWDDIDTDLEPSDTPADFVDESDYATEVREREERKSQQVDDVAVERRIAGDRHVPITKAERRAIVARCNELGWTDHEIEARTGIAADTAMNDRRHLGLAAITPDRVA